MAPDRAQGRTRRPARGGPLLPEFDLDRASKRLRRYFAPHTCAYTSTDHEDMAQEVLLRYWERCVAVGAAEVRDPSAYLGSIAANLLRDHWAERRGGSIKHGVPPLSIERVGDDALNVPDLGPGSRLEDTVHAEHALRTLLRNLDPVSAQMIILADGLGMSSREIAHTLGKSTQAISKRVSRGRQSLRDGHTRRRMPGPRVDPPCRPLTPAPEREYMSIATASIAMIELARSLSPSIAANREVQDGGTVETHRCIDYSHADEYRDEGVQFSFDVPSGPVHLVLEAFILQTQVQLLYNPESIGQVQLNGIRGNADAVYALQLLLRGSGLDAAWVNGCTVVIDFAEKTFYDIPARLLSDSRAAGDAIHDVDSQSKPSARLDGVDGCVSSEQEISILPKRRRATCERLRGVMTRAVRGWMAYDEAMTRMLEGTGFTFSARERTELSARILRIEEMPTTITLTLAERSKQNLFSEQIEEVLVTGSLLGLDAVTAPLHVVSKKEKQRAPYATVSDVLRALPFVSGAGPSEDVDVGGNYARGVGVNLRGLGVGATLVLVDGQRQPTSGTDVSFVDLLNIPWSAVERVEVLLDGASAVYGSDAIAGVVNIILRKDLEGLESVARLGNTPSGAGESLIAQLAGGQWASGRWLGSYQYSRRGGLQSAQREFAVTSDKRPLGGTDYRSILSSPGNVLDPRTGRPVWGIPVNPAGQPLRPDELHSVPNLQNRLAGTELLPDRSIHNLYLRATQNLGGAATVSWSGRYSHRSMDQHHPSQELTLMVPRTNPHFVDPVAGSAFLLIGYNLYDLYGPIHVSGQTENYVGTLEVEGSLGSEWRASARVAYGEERLRAAIHNQINPVALSAALARTDPSTAFNPFGTTATDMAQALRLHHLERAATTLANANVKVDGPLLPLPAGDLRLAVGVEYRGEQLAQARNVLPLSARSAQYRRDTQAALAELAVPLAEGADLSLAGRAERYDDSPVTWSTKFSVRWSLSGQLRLRGSWNTSFRAPSLVERYSTWDDFAAMLRVQKADGDSANVLFRQGSNQSLMKESAEGWTAGIDWSPTAMPALTASLTYYAINLEDRIHRLGAPLTPAAILSNEIWAPFVTRQPSPDQMRDVCESPSFRGDVAHCLATKPAAIIDARIRNVSISRLSGVDLQLDAQQGTAYGQLIFGLRGSYVRRFREWVTPLAPPMDVVDTVGGPPRLRARATAEWHQRGSIRPGWSVSLGVSHVSGHEDTAASATAREVKPWTTMDLNLLYRTQSRGGWFSDVEVSLNAVNLFDRPPPFVNRELGYDAANFDPYGRVMAAQVQANW